jgi:hypothetical protein
MSAPLLSAPEREGATFGLAIRALGLLAAMIVTVTCWAILIRFDGEPRSRVAVSGWRSPFPATALTVEPSDPGGAEAFAAAVPSATLVAPAAGAVAPGGTPAGAESGPGPTELAPPLPAVAPAPEHPAHQVADLEARTLVERGLRMREEGDTPGCLEALKQADGKSPGHPKILAELATTYFQMGQEAKSASYWEAVHAMGAENAGAYWDLADMALKGQLLEEGSTVSDRLRIGRHQVRVEAAGGEGEQRLTLRVHVEAVGAEPVDYRQMYLQVFFYDMVNESRFEQTIADVAPRYVSAPYDWKEGGEEVIEVAYHLPELSPAERASHGQRQFFGYLIELYYQDILQDLVAAPRKLARFGTTAPSPADSDR